MTGANDPGEVESPCIQVCTLDDELGYCTGCGRTRAEVWNWTRCNDDIKRKIVENAARRIQRR
jgi:uncharacterized protein